MSATIPLKVDRFFKSAARTLAAAVLILASLCAAPAEAYEVLLGTAEAGSFSHFAGKAVCRAVNRHANDVQCSVVPSADDVHNITNLAGGSLDICLLDAPTIFNAVNRLKNFTYLDIRYDNLLSLQRMYDIPITLVVRNDAGIASLDELKGKRVNAGTPGSPQHRIVDALLNAKGWTQKDFSLMEKLPESQSQAGMAFCHGTLQAMVHIGVHPAPSVQQLVKLCGAGLLGIDGSDIRNWIGRHPAFFTTTLPGGLYPNQAEGITTLGTGMMLIASQALDEETVFGIMDALYRSQKQLKSAHPALAGFSDHGADDPAIGLERHPGAVRYFSEN